ncbi:substrate-binding family protein [Chitinophaga skermanii]|uniref:Substrate-binding family protein n=1 Tax=Chitinophaga skermanii TaxID=331697 RepID=A0A327QQL5_9BACT|nr:helical backbone metal receptor [Chitinophaga skermanii]RAJ06839.1 substrate-binding family protein [Chitinophaga skermanii]
MQTKQYIDQMGRAVEIPVFPQRIVSVVPSQTELLADLGLDEAVVGITKFCIHPETWFRSKTRIGGTKQFKFDVIKALQPDVIIANKEENTQSDIEQLMATYPVWISDIHDIPSACAMIESVGDITGTHEKALLISQAIQARFARITPLSQPVSVAYFIWRDPWMVAAPGTFIDHILTRLGMENAFAHTSRYPAVTAEDIVAANPSLVFLSSEPYPFKEKHIEELRTLLPHAEIRLVDGEMFSWYGSRLLEAAGYLDGLMRAISIV